MTDHVSQRIASFYDGLVDRFGHDPRACDYGSAASQAAKFHVLSEVIPLSHCSVLDVGCGFADYADFLEARFSGVQYTGVDLSSRMHQEARRRRPDLELFQESILDRDDRRMFDVVTANGVFYLLGDEAQSRMRQLVARMFALARRAVAFNSLSMWASERSPEEFYADPCDVLDFCRQITPWVTLRHDYLPHDFTVYMYRDRVGG